MRKIIFFSLTFCLIYSCNNNSDDSNDISTDIDNTVFQYSIIIKDITNADLLAQECFDGRSCPYPPSYIDMIFPFQQNVNKQSYSREKYENEYRLVVQMDFKKEISNDFVESILELFVLKPGCDQDGIFTLDTIRCEVGFEEKRIICKSIHVNGQLKWEKSKDNIEPFITLLKEPCLSGIVCSKP